MNQAKREYNEAPFEHDWATPVFLPDLLKGRELCLTNEEKEMLLEVSAFPTPGHSPGHISVQLLTPEGTVVLAADALKTAREASIDVPDLEFDHQKRGQASLQDVLRRGRVIVPGHFPQMSTNAHGKISLSGVQELPLLFG